MLLRAEWVGLKHSMLLGTLKMKLRKIYIIATRSDVVRGGPLEPINQRMDSTTSA